MTHNGDKTSQQLLRINKMLSYVIMIISNKIIIRMKMREIL